MADRRMADRRMADRRMADRRMADRRMAGCPGRLCARSLRGYISEPTPLLVDRDPGDDPGDIGRRSAADRPHHSNGSSTDLLATEGVARLGANWTWKARTGRCRPPTTTRQTLWPDTSPSALYDAPVNTMRVDWLDSSSHDTCSESRLNKGRASTEVRARTEVDQRLQACPSGTTNQTIVVTTPGWAAIAIGDMYGGAFGSSGCCGDLASGCRMDLATLVSTGGPTSAHVEAAEGKAAASLRGGVPP